MLSITSSCVFIELNLMNRPHERQDASNGITALHRCCCLARIAHKYHFQAVETWALETLSEFWTGADRHTTYPKLQLVETTNIAFLCQHPRLTELITSAWMEIVRSANDPASAVDLSLAINVAEQHSLSNIMGRAYYALMILGRDSWERDCILNRPQRLRLLYGFHDLALQCSSLPTQAAPNITHSGCQSAYTFSGESFPPSACQTGWSHMWRKLFRHKSLMDAFNKLSPADLVGRLLYIANHLQEFHDALLASTTCPMPPACLESASIKIKAASDLCMNLTPKLFVDPK
jgi:hypothetical protein